MEQYKVQLGTPDTQFIFNTLGEAQDFASKEGSASGIKTTIIKFEVVEDVPKDYMVLGLKDMPLDINAMEVCEKDNPLIINSLNTAIKFAMWIKNTNYNDGFARVVELVQQADG